MAATPRNGNRVGVAVRMLPVADFFVWLPSDPVLATGAHQHCRRRPGDLAIGLKVPGICSGASARWCCKILTEREPRETRPEKSVARELQGQYDSLLVSKKANNVDIWPCFKAARLQAVEGVYPVALCRGDLASTSLKVRNQASVYGYGPPGHAIGAAKRSDGEFCCFEPERGLFRLNDRVRFKNKVGNNFVTKLNSPYGGSVRVELTCSGKPLTRRQVWVLCFAFLPNNTSLGPRWGPGSVTLAAHKTPTKERQQAGGDWPFHRENSSAPVGQLLTLGAGNRIPGQDWLQALRFGRRMSTGADT